MNGPRTLRLYRSLTGAGGDLRDSEVRNFLLFVASHFLTKLGDALTNPKTTLTWLAGTLGAASWITALLVPLRESGSMLVQVGLAGAIERFRHRKWAWSLGALLQALCILAMGGSALLVRGDAAGGVILGLLALFALSRSLSSVASKDVLGRTLPKARRGRATGWAASAAGLATLAIGLAAVLLGSDTLQASGYAMVLAGAALMWLAAAALFTGVREPSAEARPHGSGTRLRMLRGDRRLQRFVLVRALLTCTALSAPYYVMLGQSNAHGTPRMLAAFIVAGGLAAMLGGPVFGRLADRSSRTVMTLGGAGGGALGLGLSFTALFRGDVLLVPGVMAAFYFLLSLAHQAVRIGRKTYVVDMAEGNRRTDYVAVSNSAISLVLLGIGGAAAALSSWSVPAVLALLAVMGLAGAILSLRLPRVAAR